MMLVSMIECFKVIKKVLRQPKNRIGQNRPPEILSEGWGTIIFGARTKYSVFWGHSWGSRYDSDPKPAHFCTFCPKMGAGPIISAELS